MTTSIRKAILAALATLATLALGAGTASAATGGLEYLSSFNAPGAGFSEPSSVTVDQSNGDVYVVDPRVGAVDVFDSAGVYQSALTGPFGQRLLNAAVDEATGQVFVSNEAGDVEVFSSAGVHEATWTGSNTPQGVLGGRDIQYVAVDNSKSPSDPSAGDVYVATGSTGRYQGEPGLVDKFNVKGEYLGQFTGSGGPEGIFGWEEIRGIAVGSNGEVFVLERGSSVVDEFSPEGKYIRRMVGPPSGGQAVAVNGADGDIYFVDGSTVYLFNLAGELQAQIFGTGKGPFSEPAGIAFDESSGDAYLSEGATKLMDRFGPAPLPPQPSTEAPSDDTGTSVMLNGELNPGGVSASYFFSYAKGTTTCAESSTSITEAGSGSSPVHEELMLSVEPDTQYTVCIDTLIGETSRVGPPVTFTTKALKPTVEATGVTPTLTVTTLEPVVNANKQTTTCEIEYGLTEAYGTSEPCEPGELGAVYEPQHPSLSLRGLAPHTVYHYRVVATNATGTTYSADQLFKTPGPLASSGAVSAVGQTSANVTGTVNPDGAETHYFYEYGPTTGYGQSTAPEGAGVDVGEGTGPVAAPASLVPLVPGVTYHYRLVAWSEEGTTYGQDETFTTEAGHSPAGSTGAPSGITVDEATISGTVNPEGKETSYRFEYGENTNYGTVVFGTAQAELGIQTVTLNLRGIQADTTYHYRIVVSNAGGTVYGEDMSFTTLPIAYPLIAPTPPPLLGLPGFTFPSGNEVGTTNLGKTKKHGKKKHKKAKKKAKAKKKRKRKKG
jgi:hypothetical protein